MTARYNNDILWFIDEIRLRTRSHTSSCPSLKDWRTWLDLEACTCGAGDYNDFLDVVADKFQSLMNQL